MEHLSFKEKIKQWWCEEKPEKRKRMFQLYKKLKHIKYRVNESNKDTFGNINREKNTNEEKIKKLQETCILQGYNGEWKKKEIQMTQDWDEQ
jgi:UTP:GlnB (protein PII) uridylyltransferase